MINENQTGERKLLFYGYDRNKFEKLHTWAGNGQEQLLWQTAGAVLAKEVSLKCSCNIITHALKVNFK